MIPYKGGFITVKYWTDTYPINILFLFLKNFQKKINYIYNIGISSINDCDKSPSIWYHLNVYS